MGSKSGSVFCRENHPVIMAKHRQAAETAVFPRIGVANKVAQRAPLLADKLIISASLCSMPGRGREPRLGLV